jgi:hypothetical protein
MAVLAFDPPTSAGPMSGVRSLRRASSVDSDPGKRQTQESRDLLPVWADGPVIGKVGEGTCVHLCAVLGEGRGRACVCARAGVRDGCVVMGRVRGVREWVFRRMGVCAGGLGVEAEVVVGRVCIQCAHPAVDWPVEGGGRGR